MFVLGMKQIQQHIYPVTALTSQTISVFLRLALRESLGQYLTVSFVDTTCKLNTLIDMLDAKCKYMWHSSETVYTFRYAQKPPPFAQQRTCVYKCEYSCRRTVGKLRTFPDFSNIITKGTVYNNGTNVCPNWLLLELRFWLVYGLDKRSTAVRLQAREKDFLSSPKCTDRLRGALSNTRGCTVLW